MVWLQVEHVSKQANIVSLKPPMMGIGVWPNSPFRTPEQCGLVVDRMTNGSPSAVRGHRATVRRETGMRRHSLLGEALVGASSSWADLDAAIVLNDIKRVGLNLQDRSGELVDLLVFVVRQSTDVAGHAAVRLTGQYFANSDGRFGGRVARADQAVRAG